MGYLNNQIVTVDAILTKKGRELLARGDGGFVIDRFALSDDEVDYTLYNPNHPSGSAYYGEAIENMPLLEAFPDETQMMKYKLVSLPRGTSVMPTIQVINNLTRNSGTSWDLQPITINYNNQDAAETSGYQFTISDSRVFGSFIGTGGPQVTTGNSVSVITNGTAVSATVIGTQCNGITTSVPTLFTNNPSLFATMTIIGLDSGARAQIPVRINNAGIQAQAKSI
jgi:hypothetical protein|tara:strand:- start:247 stop:921 length:675 start_codon:yes stop_codon:yes gene_type:complete